MRTNWTTLGIATFLACLAATPGCGSGSTDNLPTASIPGPTAGDSGSGGQAGDQVNALTQAAEEAPQVRANPYPEVEIKTSLGRLRVKLFAEKTPQTVENFLVNYVDRGFYTGTVFHYVESGYIVMAGGYTANLEPKQARAPIRNEARDAPQNKRWTIAMSRDPEYADSATSQFFINLDDNVGLDYREADEDGSDGYCVFGEVVEGTDVLERMSSVQVKDSEGFPNVPVDPIVIESVSRLDSDNAAS